MLTLKNSFPKSGPRFFFFQKSIHSGQIIATSHDLGPQKVAFRKGNPLISGKSRLVKYYSIWLDPFYPQTVDGRNPKQPPGIY